MNNDELHDLITRGESYEVLKNDPQALADWDADVKSFLTEHGQLTRDVQRHVVSINHFGRYSTDVYNLKERLKLRISATVKK